MQEVVPFLVDAAIAQHGNRWLAREVLCGFAGLGELGIKGWGEVGLPLLLEALQDSNSTGRLDMIGRLDAIRLLGDLGREAASAIPLLRKELAEDLTINRAWVQEALQRISATGL